MKKFSVHIVLFLILVYILSMALNWGYTRIFREKKSNQSKKNWILMRAGDDLDYITVGSSRVFHMIDVPLLNRMTSKKGLNLATSGSSYADIYALLVKYLQKNKVKTIVLNIDEFSLNSSTSYTYPFKDYDYMPYFFEDTIRAIYKDNVPKWKYRLWSTIPLSRYIEYNEHYDVGSWVWQNTRTTICQYDTTAGTSLLFNLKYRKFSKEDTCGVHQEELTVDDKDVKYLLNIISFCKSKAIQLVLITPPLYTKGKYSKENRTQITSFMENLANEHDLLYVNFYNVPNIQAVRYFRDVNHINYWGARIYTKYLAEQIGPVL